MDSWSKGGGGRSFASAWRARGPAPENLVGISDAVLMSIEMMSLAETYLTDRKSPGCSKDIVFMRSSLHSLMADSPASLVTELSLPC